MVPARNEADVIARSIGSLLAQDYPGDFRIVLVDDQSDDGTGDVARALERATALTVLTRRAAPAGWTGKLWAMKQGVEHAAARRRTISGSPMPISRMRPTICAGWWRGPEASKLVLASLMARLSLRNRWPSIS